MNKIGPGAAVPRAKRKIQPFVPKAVPDPTQPATLLEQLEHRLSTSVTRGAEPGGAWLCLPSGNLAVGWAFGVQCSAGESICVGFQSLCSRV